MLERLVERDAELAALRDAVEAASDGRGSFVLIAGEAGAGKTSLVRELARHALVCVGACEPLSVPSPLAPVRELAADLPQLGGDDRVGLARALLSYLAAERRVAVVEDAHWADPASLEVLRAVARRIEEVSAVVIVTYRDDELGANPALMTFVGDLATVGAVRRIALRPLSVDAVRLLAERAGVDASKVVRLTNGNPFLVVETISAAGGLPATVRDATLARVARLDAASRSVVEAAAVIGTRVPLSLLREVEPHERAALESALARGVLVNEEATLGFRHELTRQAIEESISPQRVVDLHARALSALAGGDPARLAHHAERAGVAEDAARYALLAAAEAERVGALAEASRQLERALRVDAAPADRFELLLRYARATNFSGGLEAARAAAEEAVVLAQDRLGAPEEGRAQVVLSWSLWSLDRIEEARAAADRAVTALADIGDREYARALAARLRMESIAFDPAVVVAEAPQALELAERVGSVEARIDIAISLGLARGHLGESEALDTLLEALEDAKSARLPFQTIRAYVNAVDVAADLRAHLTVDELAAEAIRRLDTFQTAIPLQTVQLSVARSLLDRGRFDEAVEAARASRRDRHGGVSVALGLEGVVAARRGEDGGTLLEQAWDQLVDLPDGWRHGVLRVWRAEAAWLSGNLADVPEAGNAPGRPRAELAMWSARVRGQFGADWQGEIERWRGLDAPYEAALAALPGDDRAAREAVGALRRLGAHAAARAFVRERRRLGFGAPRGPLATTLANPAGLTRREHDVLGLVAQGATNNAIAAALHLSERTVAHHVSSILAKLDAPTRTAAVEAARRIGLLKDGPVAGSI